MKKKLTGLLLSMALTVTSVFGGFLAPSGAAEVKAAEAPAYRNVMYYGEWSIYSGQKNFYPSKIDGSYITHLNFAFLDMDANGDLVLCDEHADFQVLLPEHDGLTYGDPYAGVLGAMSILRSKYPNMKIGISVGGWTRSGDFAAVAADPKKRENFAKNITKFVDYLGYDFVDIDWEYPTAVRASDAEANGVTIDEGCPGTEADTKNFTLFMQAIRDELDKLGKENNKHYELSAAMSASPAMMEKIEYDKIVEILDFVNMMTYDLNGAWNGYTGHQTALYTNPAYDKETQQDGQFSVDTCIQYLKKTYGDKIDYSKIVVGVAPYTRGWAGVEKDGKDAKNPGLYATAKPNSVKAPDGTTSGTFAYGDIETLKSQYQLKEYYDETAQAAYYYSEDTGYFFTCDNERSVKAKGDYVKENKLGGLISWMASLDSANSITKTMKESLYGDAKLPEQEIVLGNPKVDVSVEAKDSTYTITIKNNETAVEKNTALKNAELFKKTILNPKLYIKSKTGATFSAGTECGSVTNKDGYGVIDLSGVYAAKSMKPGTSHTFTVNVIGTANVSDIEGISMTQRVLTTMDEFGMQNVFGADVEEGIDTDKAPEIGEGTDTEDKDPGNSETDTDKNDPGNSGTDTDKNEPGNSGTDTDKNDSENGGTDTDKKDPENGGNIGTGNYKAWASGTSYAVGDLVSYQGKVYECINPHTSQADWLPGSVESLWKERTDLVQSGDISEDKNDNTEDDSKEDNKENNYYVNGKLPQHMVTGYWHNFVNGSANLKLSDVPEYYDMICVAFTGNTTTPGEVTFALDEDLCTALGGYTKAEFIQDIKDLKEKGQHVIISVGGAEGRIEIDSEEAANIFAEGLIDIIEEYGFEGVDIDLEGSAVSGVNYIADALRTVHDHFGKDFIITMAPETYYIQASSLSANDITTAYLRLALEIKDILTICYPQFYNSGQMNGYGGTLVSSGNADFLTSLSTLIIEAGLRPDQVALGVPSITQAASSGYVKPVVVENAVLALVNGTSSGNFTAPKAYPTLRGVMTWSINWDATNDYKWAKAMDAAMEKLPVVDNGSTDIEDTDKTPDDSEDTDKTPDGSGDTDKNPDGSGDTDKTPDGSEDTDKIPDDTGDSNKNPNGSENTDKNPGDTGDTNKNPDGTEDTDKTPDGTGDNDKIPDGTGDVNKTPAEENKTPENQNKTDTTQPGTSTENTNNLQNIPATETEKSATEPAFAKLRLKASGQSKAVKLTWKKMQDADGYILYGSKKGKASKIIATYKGNSKVKYTHKKLETGKYYTYYVVAYRDANAQKQMIATSKTVQAATNGGKYGNPSKVTVKPAKVTVKVGSTKKLKATCIVPKNKKTGKKLAYESSNPEVASVNSKGASKGSKKVQQPSMYMHKTAFTKQ